MNNNADSVVSHIKMGEVGVAMMINGTSDSSFTLLRGVPSNKDKRIDEYLWSVVRKDGHPVELSYNGDNPLLIEIPGAYKWQNNGTDDEQAIIDMTVYKKE